MDSIKRLAIFDDDDLSGGLLPVRAHLRKGEKKSSGKIGKDLSYFRFDTEDKALEEKFNRVYAKQIAEFGGAREIEFIVYGSTVEDVYRPCKELRTKNKLVHRCNGRECYLWRKPDGSYSKEIIPCTGGCKYKVKMPILMTDLQEAIAVNVHSTSFWDSVNLQQNLMAIQAMFGTLMGVKMILRRELKSIQKPVVKDGKRTGETFLSQDWLLTITAHPDAFAKRLAQLQESVGKNFTPVNPRLAIGDGGLSNPDQWNDDENDDDAEQLCSPEVAAAIEKLWPEHGGRRRDGALIPLADFLKSKGYDAVNHLPDELAQRTLTWLQENALKAQHPEQPKAEPGAGLDRWACGDRALALDILQLTEDLEKMGVDESAWRAELALTTGQSDDVRVSRKALTFVEATAWRDMLKSWILSKS